MFVLVAFDFKHACVKRSELTSQSKYLYMYYTTCTRQRPSMTSQQQLLYTLYQRLLLRQWRHCSLAWPLSSLRLLSQSALVMLTLPLWTVISITWRDLCRLTLSTDVWLFVGTSASTPSSAPVNNKRHMSIWKRQLVQQRYCKSNNKQTKCERAQSYMLCKTCTCTRTYI